MLQRRKPLTRERKCEFCMDSKNPTFHEYEILNRFLSERGKIQSRQRTGVCSKHQRKLSREIKRARFLSLLP